MMRYLLVLVTACSFSPNAALPSPDAGANDHDAPRPMTDAGQNPPTATCHVTDSTGLLLCLDFEDATLENNMIADTAGGHLGATTDVTLKPRGTEQAGNFYGPNGVVTIDNRTLDLDITGDLTIEMWLQPSSSGQPQTWTADNNSQYGLGLNAGLKPFCYAGNGQYLNTSTALPLDNNFHHVACVRSNGQLRAYVDGRRTGCRPNVTPIGSTENTVVLFGAVMDGGIDDIHIYTRGLGEPEIAANAHQLASADPAACP